MCKLIKRLFNKRKAKKLILCIERIETSFTLFQTINFDFSQNEKVVYALKKMSIFKIFYLDIMCASKKSKHITNILNR